MRAALSKIESVASVDVDFDTKKASITMQPGKSLTREECEKAFTGTHYSVDKLEAVTGP